MRLAQAGRPFRLIAGTATLSLLAFSWWLINGSRSGVALANGTLIFFSFFTNLSNAIAGLALLMPALAPHSAAGRFLARPDVRAPVLIYILFTGFFYWALLSRFFDPQGLRVLTIYGLHYGTPLVFLFDWLALTPHGALRAHHMAMWLAFPLVYAGFLLGHGAATGFYPYFFVNVTRIGYGQTLLTMALFLIAFTFAGWVVVGIDRRLASKRPSAP